jgi:DNA-binding response OmpR family regulator
VWIVSNILVVEDDTAIRDALVAALEEEGYETEASANGRTALRRLEENDVDLMLVDVRMPVMSGPEVVDKLRSQGSDLPVIMMSAQPARRLPRGVRFLQKPFDLDDLFAIIDEALSRGRRRQTGPAHC